jgi:hypothetical protein
MSSSYNSSQLYVFGDDGELIPLGGDHHGSLKVIQPQTFRVHSGEAFASGFFWAGANPIPDGTSVFILIQPGAGAHLNVNVSSTGGFDLFFYSETTVSATGNLQANHNKNFYSANVSAMAISEGPTITDKGTLLGGIALPKGGFFGGGGGTSSAFGTEFILKAGDTYLIEALNDEGAAAEISIGIEWYEPL